MKTTKRRDKGTGCIRQRKDGRWEARFSIDGQPPIVIYGKTKKDVQNKLFAEHRDPVRIRDPEGLTIDQWLDRWLEMVKQTRRVATYNLYKLMSDNHIRPQIGNVRLDRLTKARVYEMFDKLKAGGVKDGALQEVYKVLHRAIQVAFKRDKVGRNVVAQVDKPSATAKEHVILRTEDEIHAFRQAVKGSVYEVLYLTALDTGLRQGELLALKWQDVDLIRGLLHVKATLTQTAEGDLVATPPKTRASMRTVKLVKNTTETLKEYRKARMDPKAIQSSWVFPNWDGGPMRKDSFVRRELKRLMKVAKLPAITFHSLRHTHATMLALLGVPMKATQERLGHSTSRMTMEVYSHATAAMQDHAVAALDAFYENAGKDGDKISGQISGQIRNQG